LEVLIENKDQIKQKTADVVITRKLGISHCLLLINTEGYHFDSGTKLITQISLNACMEEIKSRLV
jgi:hypothetical protein